MCGTYVSYLHIQICLQPLHHNTYTCPSLFDRYLCEITYLKHLWRILTQVIALLQLHLIYKNKSQIKFTTRIIFCKVYYYYYLYVCRYRLLQLRYHNRQIIFHNGPSKQLFFQYIVLN